MCSLNRVTFSRIMNEQDPLKREKAFPSNYFRVMCALGYFRTNECCWDTCNAVGKKVMSSMSTFLCVHVWKLLYEVLSALDWAAEAALSQHARLVGAATSLSPGYQHVLQINTPNTTRSLQVLHGLTIDWLQIHLLNEPSIQNNRIHYYTISEHCTALNKHKVSTFKYKLSEHWTVWSLNSFYFI